MKGDQDKQDSKGRCRGLSVNPKTLVEKFIKDSKGRSRLAAATSVLAVFTVLITVGMLTFPAISLSGSEEALQEQGIDITVGQTAETEELVAPPTDEAPIVAYEETAEAPEAASAENVAEAITEETEIGEAAAESEAAAPADEDVASVDEAEDPEANVSESEDNEDEADEDAADEIKASKAAKNALAAADLSSARLIVGSPSADALAKDENVVASFDNIFLLQYANAEEAAEGFLRFYDHAEYVTPDVAVEIAEDNTDPEEEVITTNNVYTEEENPFVELEAAIEENEAEIAQEASQPDALIAIIDTGAAAGGNVVEAVSMVGTEAGDDNGHGQRMVRYIVEENENARILSIKALGKDGKGDVSAVVAAINYAVERGANIINLSASAYASEENAALAEAVKTAENAGVVVVGAAGNQGFNAKYYIPGNIEEATIVGASDAQGVRIVQSNFGATVDYNVVAGSTSEAAARMSGFVSAYGEAGIQEALNQGLIFETGYVPTEEELAEEAAEEEVEEAAIEEDPGAGEDGNAVVVQSIPSHAKESYDATVVQDSGNVILTAKVYADDGSSLTPFLSDIGFRIYDSYGAEVAGQGIKYVDNNGVVTFDLGEPKGLEKKNLTYKIKPIESSMGIEYDRESVDYSLRVIFDSKRKYSVHSDNIVFTVALPARLDDGTIVRGSTIDYSADERPVYIEKRDMSGAPLSNAHLQIIDEANNVVDEWDTDGSVHTAVLQASKQYTLHEESAPTGYNIAEDITIPATISARVEYYSAFRNYVQISGVESYAFCVDEGTGHYTTDQAKNGIYADAESVANLGDLSNVENLPNSSRVQKNMKEILYILHHYKESGISFNKTEGYVPNETIAHQFAIWLYSNAKSFETLCNTYRISGSTKTAVKNAYDAILDDIQNNIDSWRYEDQTNFSVSLFTAAGTRSFNYEQYNYAAQSVIVINPAPTRVVMFDSNGTTVFQEGQFNIEAKKYDENKNLQSGAKLQIVMKKNGQETVVAPASGGSHDTADANPWNVTLDSYDPDAEYWLVETEAPEGYSIADPVKIDLVESSKSKTSVVGQRPADYRLADTHGGLSSPYPILGYRVGSSNSGHVIYCLSKYRSHANQAFSNRIKLSDIETSTDISNNQTLGTDEVQDMVKRAVYAGYPNNRTNLYEELKTVNPKVNEKIFEELTADAIHYFTDNYDPRKPVTHVVEGVTTTDMLEKSLEYQKLFTYFLNHIQASGWFYSSHFEVYVYWNAECQPMVDTELIEYAGKATMVNNRDNKTRVVVSKNWENAEGVDLPNLNFTLYRTTNQSAYDAYIAQIASNPSANLPSGAQQVGSPITLPTDDGAWTSSFDDLEVKDANDNPYYYFVVESSLSGNFSLTGVSKQDGSTSSFMKGGETTPSIPAGWRKLGTNETFTPGKKYIIHMRSQLVLSDGQYYARPGTNYRLANFLSRNISSPNSIDSISWSNTAHEWVAEDAGNGYVKLKLGNGYLVSLVISGESDSFAGILSDSASGELVKYSNGQVVSSNGKVLTNGTVQHRYYHDGYSWHDYYAGNAVRFASTSTPCLADVYEYNESATGSTTDPVPVDYVTSRTFTFTNTYTKPEEKPTTIVLKAKKSLTGADIESDEFKDAFTFVLKDKNGTIIETVKNEGEAITFAPISLSATGEYKYIIEEVQPNPADPYMTYDTNAKEITIFVGAREDNNVIRYFIERVEPNGTVSFERVSDVPAVAAPKSGVGIAHWVRSLYGEGSNKQSWTFHYETIDGAIAYCIKPGATQPEASNKVTYSQSTESAQSTFGAQFETLRKVAYYGYPNDAAGLRTWINEQFGPDSDYAAKYSGVSVYEPATRLYVTNDTDVDELFKAATARAIAAAKEPAVGSDGWGLDVTSETASAPAIRRIAAKILEQGTVPTDVQIDFTIYEPSNSTYQDLIVFNTTDDYKYDVNVGLPFDNTFFKPGIEISKINSNGDNIGGAVLQILDRDGTKLEEWTSVAGEKHTVVANLTAGATYYLHEESVPAPYLVSADVPFTVPEVGSENPNIEVVMVDPKEGEIIITKKDHQGQGLAGAVLQIIDDGGQVVHEWTSKGGDSAAYKVPKKLEPGVYTLHEKSAPSGYRVAEDQTFTVLPAGNKLGSPFTGAGTFAVYNDDDDTYNLGLKVYQDTEPHKAYCLNMGIGSTNYTPATRVTIDKLPASVPNSETIQNKASEIMAAAWIGYPNNAAGLLGKYEALSNRHDEFDNEKFMAVTQAVIWHYTNGFNIDKDDGGLFPNEDNSDLASKCYLEMLDAINSGVCSAPSGSTLNVYYAGSCQPVLEPYFPGSADSQIINLTMTDMPLYDLRLLKVNNDSAVKTYVGNKDFDELKELNAAVSPNLKGAEFTFKNVATEEYLNEAGKWVTEESVIKTDESGVIEFGKLAPGVYTLTETKAPSGYQQLANGAYWTITIEEEFNDDGTYKGVSISAEEHSQSNLGCEVDGAHGIVCIGNNVAAYTLPATGGVGTQVFAVLGGLLMLVAGALYVRRTGRANA